MELISLEEAKAYLRVDTDDEDGMIDTLLSSAGAVCVDVGRLSEDTWEKVDDSCEDDDPSIATIQKTMKVAILYALGYLYEHREKADYHDLALTLRSLLFAIREGVV